MKFFKQKEFLILFPIRNELSYKAIKLNHIPAFPSFPINGWSYKFSNSVFDSYSTV